MDKDFYINVKYKFLMNFFRLTLPFLVMSYIYRTIDSNIMGNINFAESYYSVFNSFCILGTYELGIREVSRERGNKIEISKIASNLFYLFFISAIINFILYLGGIIFIKVKITEIIFLMLSIKIFFIFFNVEWINEGLEDYKFISLKTIILRTVILLLMLIFIRKSEDILYYIILNILFDFFNNIISFIYVTKYKKIKIKAKFINKNIIFKYLKTSFLVFLMTQSSLLFFQFDKIYLGFYLKEIDVAYYNISERLVMIIITIIMTMIQVTLPRLSYYKDNCVEKYNILIKEVLEINSLILIPAIIGIILLSKEILYIFGGIQYVKAQNLFSLFSIYIIIFFIINILGYQILFLYKQEKLIGKIFLCVGLINIILKIFFLKNYLNVYQVLVITELLYFLIVIFLFIAVKKVINLNLILSYEIFIKIIISTMLFAFCVLRLKKLIVNSMLLVIIAIPLSVILYLGSLFLLKEKNILKLFKYLKGRIYE